MIFMSSVFPYVAFRRLHRLHKWKFNHEKSVCNVRSPFKFFVFITGPQKYFKTFKINGFPFGVKLCQTDNVQENIFGTVEAKFMKWIHTANVKYFSRWSILTQLISNCAVTRVCPVTCHCAHGERYDTRHQNLWKLYLDLYHFLNANLQL